MANYDRHFYEKVEDKIYRLTLNRPEKLNALSQKLLRELDLLIDEYESNPDASVLIICGGIARSLRDTICKARRHPGSTFTVTGDCLGLHKTSERWQRLWSPSAKAAQYRRDLRPSDQHIHADYRSLARRQQHERRAQAAYGNRVLAARRKGTPPKKRLFALKNCKRPEAASH